MSELAKFIWDNPLPALGFMTGLSLMALGILGWTNAGRTIRDAEEER